jgi:hypothetical protein
VAKATGFDFLLFPDDLEASMFTKMALKATVDIGVDDRACHTDGKSGGIIVFSSDTRLVPKIFAQWGSVGRFFKGRYRTLGGLIFDGSSQGLELMDFTTVTLLTFAAMLAKALHRETVLVKDYGTNKLYFVDQHPASIADFLKIKPKKCPHSLMLSGIG